MTGQRQRDITEWADAAFGPLATNARGAARMLEEVAELVTAVTTGAAPDRIAGECADVMICALRLAAVEGFDLEVALATHEQLPLGTTDLAEEILYFTAWVFERVVLKNSFYTPLVFVGSRLRDLCRAVGRDLLAEVDAKMEVNRRREWVPDGTGCGRHVKMTATGAAT